jgi:hypothetical protein
LAYKKHKRVVLKDPKKEADRAYSIYFKKKINWDNPKNLIEKIYWLQFNTDTSLWTKYADKYLVRDYIKECGFQEHLPELYGKWDNPEDIDFKKLPDSFVLKANNGCGTVLVVKDKSKLNIKSTKKKLKRWLSITYGYGAAQLHYTKIQPCIIAEELLPQSEEDKTISPNSLIDYKIYCINGEPQIIWVAYNRSHDSGVEMTMYNINWEKTPQHLVSSDYYTYNEKEIPKPTCLQEMLEMSEKLSSPFPQLRVDLYVINNKPIIGELTFTTGFVWFTYDYYDYLGSKIDLNKANKLP